MRFSLRWLLAATAYVAVLIGAIGTQSYLLTDLLWYVALFAFCYATIVTVVSQGKRRAMAIGFLVLSSSHLICSYSVPGYLPFARVYGLCGYYVQRDGMIYEPAQTTAGRVAPRIVGVEGSRLPDFRTS